MTEAQTTAPARNDASGDRSHESDGAKAARGGQSEGARADGPHIELLSFRVGSHDYSIDIMSVREIRSWTRATSLPHAPHYVRGVINLRGTVLPVIDLATRLGLQTDEPNERSVVIVVDHGGRIVGLRVDAVSDILSVQTAGLQPPPGIGGQGGGGFIRALTLVEERMVRVLDMEAVMPPGSEAAA